MECKFCEKEIIEIWGSGKYCNKICQTKYASSIKNCKKQLDKCSDCGKEIVVNLSRTNFIIKCKECKELNIQKKRLELIKPGICEYCNKNHNGTYGSGRFCSKECAHGFSTKNNKEKIYRKVSKALTKEPYIKICKTCTKYFETKRKYKKYCSKECSNSFRKTEEYKKTMSIVNKKRCENVNERLRLKEIGRKGGFGKKGYTNRGVYYESNFEKSVFEYLDKMNIIYEAHKHLPNSSKVSDLYIKIINIWIELDGINREKRKIWLGQDYIYWLNKLKIYEENNLNYKIFYNLNQIKEFINKNIGFKMPP